jgi:uncharacterized protein
MSKKTLVLGASTDASKYSNIATHHLLDAGHEVVLFGIKKGEIKGLEINTERLPFEDIDTVTVYINPARQVDYYDYLLGLKPKRIIFNPETENGEFSRLAQKQHIETTNACTLVLLSIGDY